MPFYEITTEGEDAKRLVKAESAAAAIRFCAKGKFQARTISNVDEAAGLFTAGVKVEDANAEPVEEQPQAEPETEEPPVGGDAGEHGDAEESGKTGKRSTAPPSKDD